MNTRRVGTCLLLFACALQSEGCRNNKEERIRVPLPAQVDLVQTPAIDYADSEAFDAVLLAALIRQDRIIVVQTPNAQPDWSGRLTAWIAAWNKGPPVQDPQVSSTRSLIDLPPDTTRETHKVVVEEMDRIERLARESVAWWQEEQKRQARIEMLKPYMFCVKRDEKQRLQVVFYR